MKKIVLTMAVMAISMGLSAQTFTTNETPVGMEHNVLFYANRDSNSITVSQTGSATLNLNALFDGKFPPSYTTTAPTESDPTVILIEGLPYHHIQLGAWVGWSTRYWEANRFKIEGYDTYLSANTWKTIADYSTTDYIGRNFTQKIPSGGAYTKLRFTFYSGVGTDGRLGVSELFFIHPEAVSPYQGLFSALNVTDFWEASGESNIYYSRGNVGIGTTTPSAKLQVVNITDTGTTTKNGISVNRYTTTAVDVTSYDKAIMGQFINYDIPSGITDNGYKIGVDASAYANNITDFAGTLRVATGILARSGIYRAAPGAKIENAYAVYADLLSSQANTTITNAYGVYINNGAGTTDITNNYGVYQATQVAKNYFAGNVGIGVPNSTAKLDVKMANANFRTFSHGTEITANTNGGWARALRIRNLNDGKVASFGVLNGNAYIATGFDTATDGTGYQNQRLTITADGYVGIGTQDTKGFELGVNGKIVTEEVKVALYENWPDYVFESNYNLPTLETVEEYIQEEGHLKGIPSAENVKKDGFFLGDMNAKLLQKIEELTLYTINQEKKIKQQAKEIEALKSLANRVMKIEEQLLRQKQ